MVAYKDQYLKDANIPMTSVSTLLQHLHTKLHSAASFYGKQGIPTVMSMPITRLVTCCLKLCM
jgi:hypothetical protein